MRLRKSQVRRVAHRIHKTLTEQGVMVPKAPEDRLLAHIEGIITEDLMVEDKLNDEVRQIMEQYSSEIQKGHVDYHKVFQMIKRKLVRERNLVL